MGDDGGEEFPGQAHTGGGSGDGAGPACLALHRTGTFLDKRDFSLLLYYTFLMAPSFPANLVGSSFCPSWNRSVQNNSFQEKLQGVVQGTLTVGSARLSCTAWSNTQDTQMKERGKMQGTFSQAAFSACTPNKLH